ncbi:MAG: histidine phosphatase family protein [Bacteroidales bacterium]|nr:histidine phosphatase family protein [Bacteroidales bacterium]
MKKLAIAVLCILAGVSALAQSNDPAPGTTRARIEANPVLLYGEYGVYVPGESLSRAPRGYKPFYIAIYCRHGARYALQETVYEDILEVFTTARDSSKLTPAGEDFLRRYEKFYPHVAHKGGLISEKGKRQLYDMGVKMVKDYPTVFKGRTEARGVATAITRTQESLKAFIAGVKETDPEFSTTYDAGDQYNSLLLPRAAPVAEKINLEFTPEAIASRSAFSEKCLDPAAFAAKFFTDVNFLSRHARPDKFQKWMRTFIIDIPSIDYEPEDKFEDIFTFDELYSLWRVWNYGGYLMLGNSPLMSDDCSSVSSESLKEIIEQADSDMASGIDLNMMFSHDVGLLPLLSYMNVGTFGARISDPERVEDYWDSSYCTMAANLQLIFYRNRKGDVLVKPLLNGNETTLPFQAVDGPYYSWKAFKEYYNK